MPKLKPIPNEFNDAVIRYSMNGCSTTDLSKEFSVSKATVLKWMDKMGVKRHHPGVMISVKSLGKPSKQLGAKRSPEAIAKMSAARVGKPATTGFKFSDESKLKMRNAALHRIATTDSLEKMRAGRYKNRLSTSEGGARNRTRAACKRMLQRILNMPRAREDARRSELLLGYTKQDLLEHLEKQFRPGMSWEVRGSFHIDHIKPFAQFFSEGVYDPVVINALTNLQVLTPAENRLKGASFVC